MTIQKTAFGGFCIFETKNGYLIKQHYLGYTLTQAKKLFKTYYKNA